MNMLLEALTKLGFEWRQALFVLLNFLIAYMILKKYVFGKLSKTIEERQKKIEDGLSNFEKAQEKLFQAEGEAKKIISAARSEAQSLILSASKDAEKRADSILKHTNQKVRDMVDSASLQIQKDRTKMLTSLRADIVDIVAESVEIILKKKINKEENSELIKSSLKRIYEEKKINNN